MAKKPLRKKHTRADGPVPRAKHPAKKPAEQNARGYTRAEWIAADYDPAQFETARGHGEKATLPPEIRDIIGALSGPGGAEIATRLTAHALAPKRKKNHAWPHAHQLAHALESGDETLWFPLAMALAHELVTEAQAPSTKTPRARSKGTRAKASPEVSSGTADDAETSAEATTARLRHAKCPHCFTRADWNSSDTAEEHQAQGFTLGFDPDPIDGFPICPNCRHTMLAIEPQEIAQAMAQAHAAGESFQPRLWPDPPFNAEGAIQEVFTKRREVRQLKEASEAAQRTTRKAQKAYAKALVEKDAMEEALEERMLAKQREAQQRADHHAERTTAQLAQLLERNGHHGVSPELIDTWDDASRAAVIAWAEGDMHVDNSPDAIGRPHRAAAAGETEQHCVDCGARLLVISEGSSAYPEGHLVGTFCTGVEAEMDPGPVPEEHEAVF